MALPKTSGIYKITCKPTGKIYVGSAVNFYARWNGHKSRLISKKGVNPKFQNAWNKYGAEAFEFEILEECSEEKLIEREQFYLDTLKPWLNAAPVAQSMQGFRHSEETKSKMSQAHLGKKLKPLTQEHKDCLSALYRGKNPTNKGIPATEEQKRKLSEAKKGKTSNFKGKTHTPESNAKNALAHLGKKVSEETKKKISETTKGRPGLPQSEESRKKMSESLKGRVAWNKGKKQTEKHLRNNSLAHLGKRPTEETKRKMSEAHKKRKEED